LLPAFSGALLPLVTVCVCHKLSFSS
jgi:hypothetical protein